MAWTEDQVRWFETLERWRLLGPALLLPAPPSPPPRPPLPVLDEAPLHWYQYVTAQVDSNGGQFTTLTRVRNV